VQKTSQIGTFIGETGTGKSNDIVDREENVFGTVGKATDFFVPESYRQYQRETIEEIEHAYECGYRHVIIDAPTGSGKSHIVRSFAFQSGSAHILTIQKLLQDQYTREFSDMYIMKGRGAYKCTSGEGSCADGPCRRKKRVGCTTCPYKLAKINAMNAPVTVHNFDSFYYQNSFGEGFPGRKILIIDEAHNISSKFSDFMSFTIDSRGGVFVPDFTRLEDYDLFIKNTSDIYLNELKDLKDLYEADGISNEQLVRMQELSKITYRMRQYLLDRESDNPTEYVFDYVPEGKHAPKVVFRPVYVHKFASKWLFRYGERTLMLSATILDKDMFCSEVGLDPEEVYFISVPSTFPAENRPIIKRYAGLMSYKHINDTLPKIVEKVQEIADRFPERKGIVQTHSEKIANYLQRYLRDPRFTFNRDFKSPQDMLSVHERKEGSIIVASGLREGLDLRGELSKIQVFCKVPYPSLGDKVVKRKLEIDPDWYGWITSIMFVQSLGRSVRSKTEKAVTYILDSGFGTFYHRYKQFIPEYIREAIIS
jgi:ATP-dependent DNA helicase DinG